MPNTQIIKEEDVNLQIGDKIHNEFDTWKIIDRREVYEIETRLSIYQFEEEEEIPWDDFREEEITQEGSFCYYTLEFVESHHIYNKETEK